MRQLVPLACSLLIVGLSLQCSVLLAPYLTQQLIDKAYLNHDRPLAVQLTFELLAALCGAAILRAAQAYIHGMLSTSIFSSLCSHIYKYVLDLPSDVLDRWRPGEITNRFHSLRSSVASLVTFMQTMCNSAIYITLVPPFIWRSDHLIAITVLVSVPVMGYLAKQQAASSNRLTKTYLECTAECDGFQTDFISDMASIKALRLEGYAVKNFSILHAREISAQRARSRASITYMLAINCVRAVVTGGCIFYGWHQIMAGQLQLGALTAIISYLNLIYNPVIDLANGYTNIQVAEVALDRAIQLLDKETEADVWRRNSTRAWNRQRQVSIQIRDLQFAYEQGPEILSGLTMSASPGERVAIIGPSGCGKTTLLKIIAGQRLPMSGATLLDDIDAREIPLESLRKTVVTVWQQSFIFSASLRDNLLLEDRCISSNRLKRIIEICVLDDLVETLPNGLDTLIGRPGLMLSVGERQRIGIARAVLRDSPILVLDEPTANLDEESSLRMMTALKEEYSDRVLIFTSHIASTVQQASRIFKLENGRVTAVRDRNQIILAPQRRPWDAASEEGQSISSVGGKI